MAGFRLVALVAAAALGLAGCSGSSSSDDDDDNGGNSGDNGSGGTGGSGGSSTTPKPCGSLTPAEASQIATNNVATVLKNSIESVRFLEHLSLVERGYFAPGSGDEFIFADDANESLDEWIDDLRTNVFPEANVESQTANSVTYHLTPEVNCPLDEDYASFDPAGAAQEQQDCADDLAAHPARYTVSRIDCNAGDSVSVTLEIGEARIKPGVLTASATALGLSVDVAEVLRVVQDDDPSVVFDADSGGTVTARLEAASPELANFNAALPTNFVLGALDNDEPLRLTVNKSENALTVSSASASNIVTGELAIGPIDATFPFHDLIESAFNRDVQPGVPPSDTVRLHLFGLTGGFQVDSVAERLVLITLGLGNGPATVRSGADTLLTVNVNSDDGRTVTVPIELDASDQPKLSVTPGFTLDLGYSMASVEGKVAGLESFALADQVRIALTGSSPAATLMRDQDGVLSLLSRVTGPAMRVDAGNFVMTSEAYPEENVSVEADRCLLFDSARDGVHEILRGYYGGACP